MCCGFLPNHSPNYRNYTLALFSQFTWKHLTKKMLLGCGSARRCSIYTHYMRTNNVKCVKHVTINIRMMNGAAQYVCVDRLSCSSGMSLSNCWVPPTNNNKAYAHTLTHSHTHWICQAVISWSCVGQKHHIFWSINWHISIATECRGWQKTAAWHSSIKRAADRPMLAPGAKWNTNIWNILNVPPYILYLTIHFKFNSSQHWTLY